MENFFKIRAEKQEHIINAALVVFGRLGYKKASIADIAKEAGTTKGMITYYFGSKKNLYYYLMEVVQDKFSRAIVEQISQDTTDLFERFRLLTNMQSIVVKEHPAMFNFAKSVFYETEPDIVEDIRGGYAAEFDRFSQIMLDGADLSKFKPGFDPHLVFRLSTWASNGLMGEVYDIGVTDNAYALVGEFLKCLDMMQQAFYKPEYL